MIWLKYTLFGFKNIDVLGKELVYESNEVCIIHVGLLYIEKNSSLLYVLDLQIRR